MATTSKNTQKVVIPVDERETFVSLGKNFADSDAGVEEKLKTLYQLQQADNEIGKIVMLRGELPAEVSALEDEIAGLEAKTAHINELIDGLTANIDNLKNEIVSIDSDIEKYRQQLDNIANSREFDSINKELENFGLLREIAVKNINESKERIEDRKAALDEIADKKSIIADDLAAKREELKHIVESTSGQEEELQARRDSLAAKIDSRTLSAYDRIRASVHNHLAVVPVYNGSCGGCFSAITPQRLVDIKSGSKLVICEHCGRIIVSD